MFFINDHKMILYNFPLKTAQKHDLVLQKFLVRIYLPFQFFFASILLLIIIIKKIHDTINTCSSNDYKVSKLLPFHSYGIYVLYLRNILSTQRNMSDNLFAYYHYLFYYSKKDSPKMQECSQIFVIGCLQTIDYRVFFLIL